MNINIDKSKNSDTVEFGAYFKHMLNSGIYFATAQFAAMFVSNAHSEQNIKDTLECAARYFGI